VTLKVRLPPYVSHAMVTSVVTLLISEGVADVSL